MPCWRYFCNEPVSTTTSDASSKTVASDSRDADNDASSPGYTSVRFDISSTATLVSDEMVSTLPVTTQVSHEMVSTLPVTTRPPFSETSTHTFATATSETTVPTSAAQMFATTKCTMCPSTFMKRIDEVPDLPKPDFRNDQKDDVETQV